MNPFGFVNRFIKRGTGPVARPESAVQAFVAGTSVRFNDPAILRVALTHGSYVHENPQAGLESSGRMEFLGDSVLGLVVNDYLYSNFPDAEEGELTKMKSLLVSKAILARRARAMQLGRFLILGEAEEATGGRERTSILADGFESIIGGVYLDRGLEAAKKFIHEHLLCEAARILSDSKHMNYKSMLQEYVQGELRIHPVYRVRSESGPEHEKLFTVEVSVNGAVLGKGSGKSKKEAEQEAAKQALGQLEPQVNGRAKGNEAAGRPPCGQEGLSRTKSGRRGGRGDPSGRKRGHRRAGDSL